VKVDYHNFALMSDQSKKTRHFAILRLTIYLLNSGIQVTIRVMSKLQRQIIATPNKWYWAKPGLLSPGSFKS
jgi:hypothetical protein